MTFAFMYKIYFDYVHLLCYPFLFSPPFFFLFFSPNGPGLSYTYFTPEMPHVSETIRYPGTSFCP